MKKQETRRSFVQKSAVGAGALAATPYFGWTQSAFANQEKNDFAMWVRAVLGDDKLSDQLLKAKNQKQAAKFCKLRLEELSSIINKD